MVQSDGIKKLVTDYFSEKIITYGATARGADWNSTESQWLRFEQLINGFDMQNPAVVINDFGCGYGELVSCLESHQFKGKYRGYDLCKEMFNAAESKFEKERYPNCQFILGDALEPADYTVASGIFNVRQDFSEEEWKEYVQDCLLKMKEASQKAFTFNLLTLYSDPPLRKDYLYYADPMSWFDYCKRNLSKNVVLLHDYNLYEFTIRVSFDDK